MQVFIVMAKSVSQRILVIVSAETETKAMALVYEHFSSHSAISIVVDEVRNQPMLRPVEDVGRIIEANIFHSAEGSTWT